MKKLLLFLSLFFCGISAEAWNFSARCASGQLLFYTINGSYVQLTFPGNSELISYYGYEEPSGNLVIPTSVTHNDTMYIVNSIGPYAFSLCKNLTSVVISDSVTSIGNGAFTNCTGLISAVIGNNVTSIGETAFSFCTNLTSVTFGHSIESIGYAAFVSCNALQSINIPNSVTYIGTSAFQGCSSLTGVTVPASVNHLGNGVFSQCRNLVSADIHCVLDTISSTLFAQDSSFTTLNLSHPVSHIDNDAFRGCTSLTTLDIPSSVLCIDDRAFEGCSGLRSVVVSSSIGYIGTRAFADCDHLEHFRIKKEHPPLSGEDLFSGIYYGCILYVPCYNEWRYRNKDPWNTSFAQIEGYCIFTITAESAAPVMGSVTGSGEYSIDSVAVLTAIPAEGYYFLQWNDGDKSNPRSITVTEDAHYIAYFTTTSPQQGIEDVEECPYRIDTETGRLVVSGVDEMPVSLYSIEGRIVYKDVCKESIEIDVPTSGVYLLRVGDGRARKVVVIK